MLPIRDLRDRVVGFGGRVIGKDEPKYLNSPETPVFHKGQELYNLNRVRSSIGGRKRILVVEGYLDVIALVQHGVHNVVATLGTATTRNHLERLFRICDEIAFCFDGDTAGQRAAWRALVTALPLLQAGRYVSFQFLPDGEDPDTLVRKQGSACFENEASFRSLVDVLFEHIGKEVDVDSVNGRAKFVDSARPLLDQVPQGTYRKLLEQRLAEIVRLPESEVDTLRTPDRRRPMRSPIRPNSTRTEPSLVRVAICSLLHHPELAPDLGDMSWLRQAPMAGATVLADLVESLAKQPHLTGAALVERFREQPAGEHLARLLAQELPTPAEGIAAELRAAMDRLKEAAQRANHEPIPNDPPSKMSDREKEVYRRQIEDLAKRG